MFGLRRTEDAETQLALDAVDYDHFMDHGWRFSAKKLIEKLLEILRIKTDNSVCSYLARGKETLANPWRLP